MEVPTHAIQLDLGIDFSKLLQQENIPGLKLAYGISDDTENLIPAIANSIAKEISTIAETKFKHFGIRTLSADLAEIPSKEVIDTDEEVGDDIIVEAEQQPLDDGDGQEVDSEPTHEGYEDFEDTDYYDEDSEEVLEESIPEDSEIPSDLLLLVNSVYDTVFKLQSMACTDIKVYLSDEEYIEQVATVIEVDVDSIENLELATNEDAAYVVSYKNIEKENKTVEVKYKELSNDNKEEEVDGKN